MFISLNYLAFILLINMSEMENITISTSEFALGDIPDINDFISSVDSEDYLKYIYIAIAIVVAVLVFQTLLFLLLIKKILALPL